MPEVPDAPQALTPQETDRLFEILKALQARGMTIILITHEDEVATHARRVIRLRDGQIIADAQPAAEGAPR